MKAELRVDVAVEDRIRGTFKLPSGRTPRQVLPYLLRDLNLPIHEGSRKCFYRIEYQALGLMSDEAWYTLSPDTPLDQAGLSKSIRLQVVDLGTQPLEQLGNMQASRPAKGDSTTYLLAEAGFMDQIIEAISKPEAPPPPTPTKDPKPDLDLGKADPLFVDAATDVHSGVGTARVKVSYPQQQILDRTEEAHLSLTGSKWAELLGASFRLDRPPIHDLWFRSGPGAGWDQLQPSVVLGDLGVADGWEFRIGPEAPLDGDLVPPVAQPILPPMPTPPPGPTPLPPAPQRSVPFFVWLLLLFVGIIAAVLGMAALLGGDDGGSGTVDSGAVTAPPPATGGAAAIGGTTGVGSANGGSADLGLPTPLRVAPPADNPLVPPSSCTQDNVPMPCSLALAFDAEGETAWCFHQRYEGVESVIPLPPGLVGIVGVSIENGYTKKEEKQGVDRFAENRRPRTLSLNGHLLTLDPHTRSKQMFELQPPITGSELRIKIVDSVAGTRHSDVCISSIDLAAWQK
ncbi:MAG: hypothetical protein GY898_03845 [Proteobacteria bacterium]|nr:hypothetical protein [Pseudomonadota bacterium]